ncbi:MAG: hypothetical protein HUJ68_14315, partial [Clostridia bacterium]|nr:hypothetical protein [Clostridia bacterium]
FNNVDYYKSKTNSGDTEINLLKTDLITLGSIDKNDVFNITNNYPSTTYNMPNYFYSQNDNSDYKFINFCDKLFLNNLKQFYEFDVCGQLPLDYYFFKKDSGKYYVMGDDIYGLSGTTLTAVTITNHQATNIITTSTSTNLQINGENIWEDIANNIYYSEGATHFKLNTQTQIGVKIEWSGLVEFNGKYVWNDGVDVHYSEGSGKQYTLEKGTFKWVEQVGGKEIYGNQVWKYNNQIYYSNGTIQYQYNKQNKSWDEKYWKKKDSVMITNDFTFNGEDVWVNVLDNWVMYSAGYNQHYKLMEDNITWETVTNTGELNSFYGRYVWNITQYNPVSYYSVENIQYDIHRSSTGWEKCEKWQTLTSFTRTYIWDDGSYYYYSYGDLQYKLHPSTNTWQTTTWRKSGDTLTFKYFQLEDTAQTPYLGTFFVGEKEIVFNIMNRATSGNLKRGMADTTINAENQINDKSKAEFRIDWYHESGQEAYYYSLLKYQYCKYNTDTYFDW